MSEGEKEESVLVRAGLWLRGLWRGADGEIAAEQEAGPRIAGGRYSQVRQCALCGRSLVASTLTKELYEAWVAEPLCSECRATEQTGDQK